jgi:uncharacterized protein YjbI with pentapeptide repeats
MRKLKQFVSDAPKPLLVQVGIIVLLVLPPLWWIQQKNVDALNQQISALKQQIDTLPSSIPIKDRLALEKDRLSLEKDRAILQNGVYITLVQAVGAAFFFVTAYLTWRNVKATESNVRAAEEKQVTERFSKAIEHLSNEKLEVRLGGIYALERIAKDSPKDYWTIMEVLTAFVREKSHTTQSHGCDVPDEFENDDHENWYFDSLEKETYLRIATDIQAVLTILNRRDKAYLNGEKDRLDLAGVNFSWLIFPATIGFQEMNLVTANLRRAVLDEVNLTGTQLTGAYLTESRLKKTIFTNANLVEACLARANLSGANLQNADLRNANLAKATLEGTDLRGADLRGAYLGGVTFAETDLRGADLRGAIFWQGTLPEGMTIDRIGALIRGQLSRAIRDETTQFSENLVFPTLDPTEPSSPPDPSSSN